MTGLRSEMWVYFFAFFLVICCISKEVWLVRGFAFDFNFSATSINYSNIKFEGDAVSNGTVVNLTKDTAVGFIANSSGRISYNQPVQIWDNSTGELTNFSMEFSFVIEKTKNTYHGHCGDGLAFFLAPYPSQMPPFGLGGYLSLFDNYTEYNQFSKNQIVAIEFDTFPFNEWDPPKLYGIQHIGIDINIINSTMYEALPDINTGRKMTTLVNYNGKTQVLSVSLYDVDQNVGNLNARIDLKRYLPEMVAVGFSSATGRAVELHQILSWSFNSTLEKRSNSIPKTDFNSSIPNTEFNSTIETKSNSTTDQTKLIRLPMIIGSIIGISLVTTSVAFVWFLIWHKRSTNDNREMDVVFEEGRGPRKFSYNKLAGATNNFAEERKLGQGGFGSVYRGFLSEVGQNVAIKKVPKEKKEGKKAYISEVNIISRLRHRNLVQLIGWCHERGDFLLVYELMPQGSLDTHLYNSGRILTWPMRQKIALGLSSAILYLHNEWEQCVLHRDIKPSNVMLDSEFNAKLGDFGLARLIDHNCSQATLPGGTFGYLAPECVTFVRASKESDVFSFGVLLLELACGRPPVIQDDNPDKNNLVNCVWNLYGKNTILEAADERLNGEYEKREMECMMIVGLWCAHPDYNRRASIREAVNVLNFESPLPILPSKMPMPVYALPAETNAYLGEPSSVTSSSNSRANGLNYSASSTNPSSSYSSSSLP